MAKEYAKAFYNSKVWKQTRQAYLESKFCICEKCSAPAETVHHITPITPQNINDLNITLSHNNLMALCADCHNKIHKAKQINRRYAFDENGEIIYSSD